MQQTFPRRHMTNIFPPDSNLSFPWGGDSFPTLPAFYTFVPHSSSQSDPTGTVMLPPLLYNWSTSPTFHKACWSVLPFRLFAMLLGRTCVNHSYSFAPVPVFFLCFSLRNIFCSTRSKFGTFTVSFFQTSPL